MLYTQGVLVYVVTRMLHVCMLPMAYKFMPARGYIFTMRGCSSGALIISNLGNYVFAGSHSPLYTQMLFGFTVSHCLSTWMGNLFFCSQNVINFPPTELLALALWLWHHKGTLNHKGHYTLALWLWRHKQHMPPTHRYPEIYPRTHHFSRVRAPLDVKTTWRRPKQQWRRPCDLSAIIV